MLPLRDPVVLLHRQNDDDDTDDTDDDVSTTTLATSSLATTVTSISTPTQGVTTTVSGESSVSTTVSTSAVVGSSTVSTSIPSSGLPQSSTSSEASSGSSDGLSAGAASGVGVGVALTVILIAIIGWLLVQRRRRHKAKKHTIPSEEETKIIPQPDNKEYRLESAAEIDGNEKQVPELASLVRIVESDGDRVYAVELPGSDVPVTGLKPVISELPSPVSPLSTSSPQGNSSNTKMHAKDKEVA